MTNHVHLIARTKNGNLSGIIRDIKKHTSKQIFKTIDEINESRQEWLEMVFKYHAKFNKRTGNQQLWTHENHAVELISNEMITSRINYIHQNPVRAAWVSNEEDYLYSSARNYAELDNLLQIDKI
jgi:REP element-mobilizing transposase RayT